MAISSGDGYPGQFAPASLKRPALEALERMSMGLSGAIRPGLIEAAQGCHTVRALIAGYPGQFAPASLKLLFGGPLPQPAHPGYPGQFAPASLKHRQFSERVKADYIGYPGQFAPASLKRSEAPLPGRP